MSNKRIIELKARIADEILLKDHFIKPAVNNTLLDRLMNKREKDILLAVLNGLTYSVIAQVYHISSSRVGQLFWQAVNKLGKTEVYIIEQEETIIQLKKEIALLNKQLVADIVDDIPKKVMYTKIKDLGFSERVHNCLKGAGVVFVADILKLEDETGLRAIRGFGRKSEDEVEHILAQQGIEL